MPLSIGSISALARVDYVFHRLVALSISFALELCKEKRRQHRLRSSAAIAVRRPSRGALNGVARSAAAHSALQHVVNKTGSGGIVEQVKYV